MDDTGSNADRLIADIAVDNLAAAKPAMGRRQAVRLGE
jgi:hypothetical protein